MMSSNNNRLLVVGPLPCEKHNCQWGGATVLMKNFHDYLLEKGIGHRFVQTNRYVNPRSLGLRPRANQLYFIAKFITSLPWCDTVMFNFSDHGTVNMFPFLSRIAHRMGKRVVLRKFGGSFDIYLQTVPNRKKHRVIEAIQATDIIFLETQASISHIKTLIGDTDKIHWFPNVRKAASQRRMPKAFSKRLVFMSHVSNEKGMGDLLDAFALLPSDYQLDIYGAIKDKFYEHFDWVAHHVRYNGEIPSTEVTLKLAQYDLLLLPSYREGYPGIIIEALSVGIPVVSTRVGGIPEIIECEHNGLLVECHQPVELAKAIRAFETIDYTAYCNNAYQTFQEHFESDRTNEHILSLLTTN